MKKVYIAGPMTGHPKHNIPAFDSLARQLRYYAGGTEYEPVNPAEIDGPEVRAFYLADLEGTQNYPGKTWGQFLSRDLQIILEGGIDLIAVLPGWETSPGARLETLAGHLRGCKITKPEYGYEGRIVGLWELTRGELLRGWEGIE